MKQNVKDPSKVEPATATLSVFSVKTLGLERGLRMCGFDSHLWYEKAESIKRKAESRKAFTCGRFSFFLFTGRCVPMNIGISSDVRVRFPPLVRKS
jgi:hypothetical protein